MCVGSNERVFLAFELTGWYHLPKKRKRKLLEKRNILGKLWTPTNGPKENNQLDFRQFNVGKRCV